MDGQEEFYDTTKDPHEWANEIDNPEYAPVIAKLRSLAPSPSESAIPLPVLLNEE
jgi:hypothetical protein